MDTTETTTTEHVQPTGKRGGYTKEDFEPILTGKMVPPNFEEIDLSKGIATIAAGGNLADIPGVQFLKHPDGVSSWGHWARFYLAVEQSRKFNGRGYVIWQAGLATTTGHVASFAFCLHEKKLSAGANPTRGWKPGYCTKCGLDMTVDSSD